MSGSYTRYSRLKSKKTCAHPGCNFPLWKGGYCSRHQWHVAAKKPIPKYKKKPLAKTYVYGFTSLPELFNYCVYKAERPIICPISGHDITKLFSEDFNVWKCACAHILPRSRYPLWRLNPHNVLLLDPQVHSLLDQGTEAQRQKYSRYNWDYFYNLQTQLKHEYEEYARTRAGANDPAEMDAQNTEGEEESDTPDEGAAGDVVPGGHGI